MSEQDDQDTKLSEKRKLEDELSKKLKDPSLGYVRPPINLSERRKLEDELSKRLKDPSLAHVETKEAKSEVALKLKCETCEVISDFPVHCGTQMTLKEGEGLSCESCGESQSIPDHCNKPMKPMIAGEVGSELKAELTKKMKDPSLAHVETKEAKSEVALKLKCETCEVISDFPVHCGTQMTFKEGAGLSCESCGESQSIPDHCNKPMKPMIASA